MIEVLLQGRLIPAKKFANKETSAKCTRNKYKNQKLDATESQHVEIRFLPELVEFWVICSFISPGSPRLIQRDGKP